MRFRDHLTAVARVAALAILISATPPATAGSAPRPGGAEPETVEDLRDTLKLVMLSRLKRELQLSPEQERAVLPMLDELEQSRQEMRHQRRRALRDLRHLLQANAPEEEIVERLRAVREMRRGFEKQRQHIEDVIASQLSPHQQAHLLVFMQEFSRRMRQQLQQIRRQGARGGRRHLPPQEDFWDEELP